MAAGKDETKRFTLKELETQVPRLKHLTDVSVQFLMFSIFAKGPFSAKLREHSQSLDVFCDEERKATAEYLRVRNGFFDGVMERSGGLDDPNKVEKECIRGVAEAVVYGEVMTLCRDKVDKFLLEIVKYVCDNRIPDAEEFLLSVHSLVNSDNSEKEETADGSS